MANARGPIVNVRVLGTNNVPATAERRCERLTIDDNVCSDQKNSCTNAKYAYTQYAIDRN